MKKKLLGIFALIGAPFLFIDMWVGVYYPAFVASAPWFSGFAGLLYITGWLASMESLRRIVDSGRRDFGWIMIHLVMFTLVVADLSNIWLFFSQRKTSLFYILDSGWPVSNLLMLLVGWAIIKSGKMSGFRKWIPLALGTWFPICMLLGRNDFALYAGGLYSTVLWSVFAVAVMKSNDEQVQIQLFTI